MIMATFEVKRITTTQVTTQYVDAPDLSELPKENKHYQTLTWQNIHAQDDADEQFRLFVPGTATDAADGAQVGNPLTQEQIEELQNNLSKTRTMRIREAMYPETMIDAGNAFILTTQLYPGHTTAVQKLAEPAQRLKHAVINLINYQEDADVALYACPDIIRLLEDETDHLTQRRAAELVHQLSKKQACRFAFAKNENLVPILVKLMQTTNDPETLKSVCGALHHISRCEPGSLVIYRFGGIPVLVRMLSSPHDIVVNYSITTLRNLLIYIEEAKPAVRQCGGIQKMVELLNHPNPKFLAIDADCLHILGHDNQESKLIILAAGGPAELVALLYRHNYEKLLYACARVLQVLSVCTSNKPVIVEAGGMDALASHLQSPSQRLMMTCLWTLRNLSDQAFHLEILDNLLNAAVNLLAHSDTHVVTCCAGILCNLTCQNAHNKEVVIKYGAIENLVKILLNHSEREEMIEPVLCALSHITHRNDLIMQALQDLGAYQALPVLAHLGSPGVSHWPVLKSLVGLVRNIAIVPEYRQQLRSLDVMSSLAQLLLRSHTTQQQDKRASVNSVASSYIEGVRMDDMLERCLAALAMMARDKENRLTIRQLDLLPLTVQILYTDAEYLQRAALSLLCEMTIDYEGVSVVEQEGASARLTELLHSRNESVATYAAAILYRLAAGKPDDYRKRLSMELTESLQPRNSNYDLTNGPPPVYNGMTQFDTLGAPTTVLDDQPISYGDQYPTNMAYDPGMQNGLGMEITYDGGTLNRGFQASVENVGTGRRSANSNTMASQQNYFADINL